MNKRALLPTIVVASFVAAPAVYAQEHEQPGHESPAAGSRNNTASAIKDEAGHAVGTVSAHMTSSLKGFAEAAAQSDMYEIEAAKVAIKRTANKDIKAFAEEMVKAHTETAHQLKPLIMAADAAIKMPTTLDDRHQSMIDNLKGAKAADFDKRYLAQQEDAHKEALTLMRGYAKDGDVSSVKGFAAKTASIVQSHVEMVEQLRNAQM